jgi:hypothetical protein
MPKVPTTKALEDRLRARQTRSALTPMQRLFLLLASMVLCCGCVSHKRCLVTSAVDHTDVEIRKDWYGVILGICGPVTHAFESFTFRLPGEKAVYRGDEVQQVPTQSVPYEGEISILRERKRVVIDLTQGGHSFKYNGKYHYE